MSKVLSGIMGLCVADALGVPVEFVDREALASGPVTGMRGYGTYSQPEGTWSDDTSMALCLADSLTRGLDYTNIMDNFVEWIDETKFTATDEVFDIGSATRKALLKYVKGTPALESGGQSEYDNGNGSLVRILPLAYYLEANCDEICESERAMEIIHNVSSLTHAHNRSKIACGIYISVAIRVLRGASLPDGIREGILQAMKYYRSHEAYSEELIHFSRIAKHDFANEKVTEIRSSGYVIDTLEAAIWCLLNTDNYRSCVLKAVNLGGDTDTIAAVAGGIAGICYRYESIPAEWLSTVQRREYVEEICMNFEESLGRTELCKGST